MNRDKQVLNFEYERELKKQGNSTNMCQGKDKLCVHKGFGHSILGIWRTIW